MKRVSTLLKPETLALVLNEADEKSISVAAIIRQKVEESYKKQIIEIRGEQLIGALNRSKGGGSSRIV